MSLSTEPARTWPRNQRVARRNGVGAQCASCGLSWRVHRDLAGFQMRCDCEAWIEVPPVSRRSQWLERVRRGHRSLVEAAVSSGEASPLPSASGTAAWDAGAVEVQGRAPVRKPSVVRTGMLGLIGLAPWFVLGEVANGAWSSYQPLGALVGALLMLIAGIAAWPGASTRPFRAPRTWHVFEAGAVVLAVLGWMSIAGHTGSTWLPIELGAVGTGWTLFLCALGPAVFEELGFRGLLQTRAVAHTGRFLGVTITALAFSFAHGVGPLFPATLAGGLYLGSLRERSQSVVPGMLASLAFHSAIVLGLTAA